MTTLRVPGDKSISHRGLILASLGQGPSRIRGILRSADVESTAGVLRALGVAIPALSGKELIIEGHGLRGLRAPAASLDCGNSGTTARLMAGVLAASGLPARLEGDASLSARPMRRVAAPLRAMGAKVDLSENGGLPMVIDAGELRGMTWHADVASAQVKGAILLAGLVGDVPVEVHESAATRDHSERMLRARGVDVRSEGLVVSLLPTGRLDAAEVDVPGDPSSAAFIAAFVAMGGAPALSIANVGVNPGRAGFFRALARMGAQIRYEDTVDEGGEPVATVVVSAAPLRAISVGSADVPSLIDELPILACVAARAEGETQVTGAGELRVKESDRVHAMVSNLRAIGVEAEERSDGFTVVGSDRPLRGKVITRGDHRIAMAFGVLGALEGNALAIDDRSCVGVSYPTFWDDLARVRTD